MIQLAKRVHGITPSLTLAISAKAKGLQAQGIDVCNFGAGEPDFDTPSEVKKAAAAALERGETKYGPVEGIGRLRNLLAEKLQNENGVSYKPSQIQVSGGAKQALYNLMMALVGPGDEVIIPAPYWLSYPEMVRLAEATPIIVETTDESHFKMTPAQLAAAITSRTRVVIFNSPSNPTGMVYTPDEIRALAEVIIKHDILVISDEIYEKLIYGPVPHLSIGSISPAMLARTITVNGFSKAFSMTGWRLGYAAGPQEVIDAANIIQSHSLSNVVTFAQYGAIAALESDQEFIETMRQAFAQRLEVICTGLEAIPGVTCVRPEGAFYVFPSIASSGLDSVTFCQKLLESDFVAAVPGAAFGADKNIRLSYATDLVTITKGVERLGRFMGRLG